MRTAVEIVTKILNDEEDFFGFAREVWLHFLTFEQAKPLLNLDYGEGCTPTVSAETWGEPLPLTREAVLDAMRAYMATYGWDKALNHRGLSAGRTIEKLQAWIWLLGDDEVFEKVDETGYPSYGVPKLKLICETYGFPIPDDQRVVRMAQGESCRPDCDEGCVY